MINLALWCRIEDVDGDGAGVAKHSCSISYISLEVKLLDPEGSAMSASGEIAVESWARCSRGERGTHYGRASTAHTTD